MQLYLWHIYAKHLKDARKEGPREISQRWAASICNVPLFICTQIDASRPVVVLNGFKNN